MFVNGFHARSGGAYSVLTNFIYSGSLSDDLQYFVLMPNVGKYNKDELPENVSLINISHIYNSLVLMPLLYRFVLPRLVKSVGANIILNFADVPIVTHVHQVQYFDWAYAVYDDPVVWENMGFFDKLKRRIKLFFFFRWARHNDCMIAQTEVVKSRLAKKLQIENIAVLPNACKQYEKNNYDECQISLPKGKKFLCLSCYYTHKNMEVFIPLARKIRAEGLSYKIILTISADQHKKALRFLNLVKTSGLDDIIINIGPVDKSIIPAIYNACDALLLPTLLESYSGTYSESLYFGVPIFTSDRDFARCVCQGAAIYFNPTCPESIFCAIKSIDSDHDMGCIKRNRDNLNNLKYSWSDIAEKISSLLISELTISSSNNVLKLEK